MWNKIFEVTPRDRVAGVAASKVHYESIVWIAFFVSNPRAEFAGQI